jgi:hypothetical protein
MTDALEVLERWDRQNSFSLAVSLSLFMHRGYLRRASVSRGLNHHPRDAVRYPGAFLDDPEARATL